MNAPLVIAAHGTRLPEGQAAARELTDRVRALLPGVEVRVAFVELDTPTVDAALAEVLTAGADQAVVVPLMVGTGEHVREDIPEAIAAGRRARPSARVRYTPHLGPDPRLRQAVRERIAEAAPDWQPGDTTVVFLGRGCSVTDANADHVRLGRVLVEEGGYAAVHEAFIQVVQPDLLAALERAYACGARQIVVAPNYLFPGRLQRWAERGVADWQTRHPDAEVRLADVIGPCDELAGVVVDRYQAALDSPATDDPAYLTGLVLRDRGVLVVGAGSVATRRIPRLLAAGALVHVVAPEASDRVAAWADTGALRWSARPVSPSDVVGARYVLALTDDPGINEQVTTAADALGVFCVRGDDASSGTAWTPAVGSVDGLQVGVLGRRDPRRSAAARDVAVGALRSAP